MYQNQRFFPTTQQTLVQALNSPDPKTRETSLARFCTMYYPAIYGYARMLGLREEDAKDRSQDFFVEVVRDSMLNRYDSQRGTRFSSWLMKCFKNMEINHRSGQSRLKRGGGHEFTEFDPEHLEHSFRAAQLAHLSPEPTFDLMLAREIWLAAKAALTERHSQSGNGALVSDLLPLILMDRWPPRPMPSQEEMAQRHKTTPVRLKAFFNRTLKVQSRRKFDEEAQLACPGIAAEDINHLWLLLCRYDEE